MLAASGIGIAHILLRSDQIIQMSSV